MADVYGKGVIKAKRSTYMYRLPITIRKPRPHAVTVGKTTGDESDYKEIPKVRSIACLPTVTKGSMCIVNYKKILCFTLRCQN